MTTIMNFRPYRRWLTIKTAALATLMAMLLFTVTTAQAIPVRIDSLWVTGTSTTPPTVTTQAFLDTSPLTGSGREPILVTQFDLQFTTNSVVGTAVLDPLSPFFLGSDIFAIFIDGNLSSYLSGQVFIAPSTPFSGRFTLEEPLARLAHEVGFGQTNYKLQPESVITPLVQTTVAEPGALALFGVGLVGLGFMSCRLKAA